MLHAIEHAFLDSIVLVPILLVTYILMEWLEHKAKDKTLGMITVSSKLGPLIGGLVGIIPQCGFPVQRQASMQHTVLHLVH